MTTESLKKAKILIQPHPDVADLLPGYLEKRKNELKVITEALSHSDFEKIVTIGHNVKGTARSYGLTQLEGLAATLEQSGRAKDVPTIQKCLKEYEEVLQLIEIVST